MNSRTLAMTASILLALPAASIAQVPWPLANLPQINLPGVFAQRPTSSARSAAALGAESEADGDLPAAARHYSEALREATGQPAVFRDEAMRSVLPQLARVLLAQSRLDEADMAVQLLGGLQPTPAPSNGGLGFDEARRTLGAAFKLASSGARGMNQRQVVDGDDAERIAARLGFRIPSTEVPVAITAQLRMRQGRGDDVRRLWNKDFVDYLGSFDKLPADVQVLTDGEAVVATWHMALALQGVQSYGQSLDALKLAQAMDSRRLQALVSRSPVPEGLLGAFQQSRWLAGAAVDLALQGQQPKAQRLAVGALAATKSLATRHAERRRLLLATVADRSVRNARGAVQTLETRLAQLPTDGDEGVKAWADWNNAMAATLAPAMPALAKAGLGDVVIDGETLLRQVQAALKPAEAVLGFAAYQPVATDLRPQPAHYVRYTVTPQGVSLRDLGLKRDIDRLVGQWRAATDAVQQVSSGKALHNLLLADLPQEVGAASRWVIDADGLLSLLPFEALNGADGALVLDRRTVRYTNSLASLVAPRPAGRPSGQTALVMVDPNYPIGPLSAAGGTTMPFLLRGKAWRDASFAPLPETRAEGEAVRAALHSMGIESELLAGADATPSALRRAKSPAVLHIASHGFIASAMPEGDPLARYRLRMLVPGLMSGVVLAADVNGPVFNGIDLAALDLRDTRLVVLSACDTGNGSVDVHEGLLSLRRAAEEAGARASLTSLWPVPSGPTVRLMSAFYQGLAAGRNHADALRAAKLSMRSTGATVQDWAGFVLTGADQ